MHRYRKHFMACFCILMICISIYSQKINFTVEDIVRGPFTKNHSLKIKQINWINNTQFLYVKDSSILLSDTSLYIAKEVLSLKELNSLLQLDKADELKQLPHFIAVDSIELLFQIPPVYIFIDIKSRRITDFIILPDSASDFNFNHDYSALVFTLGNNLFLRKRDGNEIAITQEKNKHISYGKVVHRYEFGIEQGSFWSPENRYIAYYENDEREVTDYPVVNIEGRIAKENSIKYPMAGMANEKVSLFIYDKERKKNIRIDTDKDRDQYLTNISWGPESKYIYVFIVNRQQNHMRLNRYEVKTGKYLNTILEEEDSCYVEPIHPLAFLDTSSCVFIYQSRKDGYNHLYLCDIFGGNNKQITTGHWEVTEFMGQHSVTGTLFFSATRESPLQRHVYSVSTVSVEIQKLTVGEGTHKPVFNKDFTCFIDRFSSEYITEDIKLVIPKKKSTKEMYCTDNPYKDYNITEPCTSGIWSADSAYKCYYQLVLPVNFDSTQKYPVIFYVYGGPHIQLITNDWKDRTDLWQQYMAQKGYISFTMDPRGSAYRGKAFEQEIFRQSGVPQEYDYLQGVKFLSTISYVDTSRIGIYGWSYGGYMTTTMMLKHPDIFKVGVAGGPVIDWKYYEIMYGERYMDTPQENPKGYEKTNLCNYASSLKGKLLLIHGGKDPVVVPQHSLRFIQSCIEAGTKPDFFMYPDAEHNIFGSERIHLVRLISNYFIKNL